jgi:hypothetical protein
MVHMHPDLTYTMVKLRHEELTSPRFIGDDTGRRHRRFFRRRRVSVAPGP